MAGLDGLQSAGTSPRLGVSGFRDTRAPLRSQVPLPRPEPPSAMATTSRTPLLVRVLRTACHSPYLGMSPRLWDGAMRLGKPAAPTGPGTGPSSYLAFRWEPRRTEVADRGASALSLHGQSPSLCHGN